MTDTPIDFIAEAITDSLGPRCPEHSDGCPTCEAWAQYDRLNGTAALYDQEKPPVVWVPDDATAEEILKARIDHPNAIVVLQRMPDERVAALKEGRMIGHEEAARVAEQFRNKDWIAHDMRTGVFPKQSDPGVAIAAAIRAHSQAPTGTDEDQTVKAQESSFHAGATSFPNAEQNVALSQPSALRFPCDPTEEMVDAALAVDWENEDERATVINIWHAMTAKLPTLQPSAARKLTLEEAAYNATCRPTAVRPGSLVNDADILASDPPDVVVKKLDAAYEARSLSVMDKSPRSQALEEAAHNLINELYGNPGELIDKMAEAIRDWGSHYDDGPWETLPEDRKAGWRGDAERALAVVKEYLTARRPSEQAVTEAMELARAVLAQSITAGHNVHGPTPEDIEEAFWALDAALKSAMEAGR